MPASLFPSTGQAEVAVVESETQLLILNTVPAVVSYIGRDLRYRLANSAYLKWHGLAPEDIIGKHVSEIFSEAVVAKLRPNLERALAGESVVFETDVPRPEGGIRNLHVTYTPDFDALGRVRGFVVLASDISEQKHVEQALRESEERMSLALEASQFPGAWDWDVVNDRIVAGPRFARLFSIDPARAQAGAPLHDFIKVIHPDDLPGMRSSLAEALRKGGNYTQQYRVVQPDGSHRWLQAHGYVHHDSHGQPVRVPGVAIDVTGEHEAMEALRHSEQFTRSILASSPDCVKVIDLEGRLLSLNEGGCKQMEIDDFSMCANQPWLNFWQGDERKAAEVALHQAMEGKTSRFEGFCATAKRTPKWWEVIVTPIQDASGKPVRILSISRDITDRHNAERDRERLLRELERSNDDLTRFAHVAAHDLQSPLRMVKSYSQLLERRLKSHLDDSSREFMRMVLEGADRMDHLVAALLNYAQVGQEKPQFDTVSTEASVAAALDNLDVLISDTKAQVIHGKLPLVQGDAVQLIQLIQNLVANGIKYRRHDIAPSIRIEAETQGKMWRFAVSDNGEGIAAEHQEQIFLPLKRLHGSKVPGTGMGLAVCRKIVERHGGTIGVESRVGQGSTFFFTLPVASS